MSGLTLDFVVYLGDPDAGAETIASSKLAADVPKYRDRLDPRSLYGALTFSKGGKELSERRADTLIPLLTQVLRTVPYVIDGETETALLTESLHGVMFEPSHDDVVVSFFAGDAYEPDEHLLKPTTMKLKAFGEQLVGIGDRAKSILEQLSPGIYDHEDLQGLKEFHDAAKKAFKQFTLEVERGVRMS